jgi:hypothetical protein
MDRERIQQWVVASSKARPGNVTAHQRAKESSNASLAANAAVRCERKPPTSSVIPQELFIQGQLAWDIGISKIISQAESALNIARDTCAALNPIEQSAKSTKLTSTSSPLQPNKVMLLAQIEKSRRAKRLQAVTEDDASGLSTLSAVSDIQSVHYSSKVTASSRGVSALSASQRV